MTSENRTVWMIFRWPLLLACATVTGLLLGLVGENMANVIACLLVGMPLILIGGERSISLSHLRERNAARSLRDPT